MLDGLVLLLVLSVVIGTSSFLAGSLPLSFSLSPRQLRLISALGTGVLVGTSLIVIIPEGVETLYAASASSNSLNERAISARSDFAQVAASAAGGLDWKWRTHEILSKYGMDADLAARAETDDGLPDTTDPAHEPDVGGEEPEGSEPDLTGSENNREPHVWIGISLIFGFILMYLIDTLPQHAAASPPQSFQISLNQFSFTRSSASEENSQITSAGAFAGGVGDADRHSSRPSSTTIGLVIHAAADGIALGASSTSTSNLSFIIFIALMIHKAPAAFGLTSVLLKQGLSKRMAKAHLIVFSLAAPIGALVTFLAIRLLGFVSLAEGSSSDFATGVLLLFSGGTFLYVAMHTMQENGADSHSHGEGHGMNGYAGVPLDDPYGAQPPAPSRPPGHQLLDTLVTVGGMLLPLLTQFGHAH